MRYSRQRETILEAVKGTKCHPDAEWIYNEVQKVIPNISLGTVYRNLKSLADCGEIITLETEKNKLHYDGDTSNHIHFICKDCGAIIDIFAETPAVSQVGDMGLEVECAKTVYYGRCAGCRKAHENSLS